MENENDDLDISTQEEEIVVTESTEEPEETVEELRERLNQEQKAREKAEEIANNQRIRAEKAERKGEVAPKPFNQSSKQPELSTKDLYALMDAKVPQEDVDDVVEYAKFAKIPVTEALKNNVVKTILRDKAEMRNVAEATNTGASRRTSGKVSDETILSKASKGELPESDEGIAQLIAARRNLKK